jgi:hypothetical protein
MDRGGGVMDDAEMFRLIDENRAKFEEWKGRQGGEMNCNACRWYRHGVCHRYPPQYVGHDMNDEAVWRHPFVDDNNFCGEFKREA